MIIDTKTEAQAYYHAIAKAIGMDKFNGAHAIYTPQLLVEEVLGKINLQGNILVMFNVEFVVSLVYTYNIAPENITFYSDHDNKSRICSKLGVKYITTLETDMKFDQAVTNPPYTNGVWRKITENLMRVTDNIALVSPDDRVPQGAKAKDNLSTFSNFGILDIDEVADKHFPNVNAGAPIVVYYLKKNHETDQTLLGPRNQDDATQQRIFNSIKIIPKQNDRRFVRGLIQATPKKDGSYEILLSDKKTKTLNIKIITNISNSTVTEQFTDIQKESFPANRGRDFTGRLFIFNRHFGRNTTSHIHEITNATGIKFGNNIMVYDTKPNDTVDGFKSVYLSNLYRFALAVQRGSEPGIRDAYLNCLPSLDLSKVWTNDQIYKQFNISSEDQDYINKFIRDLK